MAACRSIVFACTLALAPTFALAITPDDPGPGDVLLTIDALQNVRTISPHIYGMNLFAGSSLTNPVTLDRLGGNRWTGYNWETNASQAGRDWYYQNDTHMGTGPPGNAVRGTLLESAATGRATVVTVPIAGYVAGDTAGPVQWVDRAPTVDGDPNTNRWNAVIPKKSTIYPGAPLSTSPNLDDGYVFTDEFVNWVEQNKQGGRVFYSLDNEPALWGEPLPAGWQPGVPPPCPPCNPNQDVDPSPEGRTHGALHPYKPTFAELRRRTIDNASAIKDVDPNAIVLGGVGYGWMDFLQLQDAPDRVTSPSHPSPGGDEAGELHFYEWLLQEVAEEEEVQNRTLMDVLDLHWYPEATGGGVRITENNNSAAVVAARVQAPRSLWDPNYEENSWIANDVINGPVKLLPRVQRDIDDFKPDTKISITEYNYGGTNHISGGIAQADVLGIFAQEDVFAATFWSLHGDSNSQFASGAFKMYLNYDGQGGSFGDMIVDAGTTNIANSSIYASVDSENPNRMVVVAINRTGGPLDAAVSLTSERRFTSAEVYRLTSASPNPQPAGDFDISLVNAFHYTMPAFSVSTLVLTAPEFEADFDGDGDVDRDDLTHPTLGWEVRYGVDLDGEDFLTWQREFNGGGVPGGLAVVPEPSAFVLLASTGAMLSQCRRKSARN